MKFNNKENEKIELSNGRTIWISRAVAVVGTVCLIKDGIPYFLLSQRGKGAADFQGLWNLPCGYLDFNETSGEAFIREVWEECGINILDLKKNSIKLSDNTETPWDVNTSPNENRQNVCLHHSYIGEVKELPIPEIRNEVEADEVSDIKWVSINEIENYQYAFQHLERIEKFILNVLSKNLNKK
jgi:8-oxo-dGTP pyrophosphatase MutT (NUDIX family)